MRTPDLRRMIADLDWANDVTLAATAELPESVLTAYDHPVDGPQRAILADLVLRAVDHATFHRGQVIGMVRQAGVVPPATSLRRYL